MKSIIKLFSVLAITMSALVFSVSKTSAQVGVSFQVFYDNLSPYGQWVDYPDYGYAWIPNAGPDFQPYASNGYWVMTDLGWTWVSNYSWGWAPFHYGRWMSDPVYGWVWIPDTEWAPAWVEWRRAPGYYGWAPLGPRVSVDAAFSSTYSIPNERWVFINERNINRPDVDRYYVNRSNNVTIIKNTTVINNVREDNSTHVKYVVGPDKNEVEKATGKTISTVSVQQSDKPGQSVSNGQLRIYKPVVQKTAGNAQKPAPRQVTNLKEVKPVAERKENGNPAQNSSDSHMQPKQHNQPAQNNGAQKPNNANQPDAKKPVNPSSPNERPNEQHANPASQPVPSPHNANPPENNQHVSPPPQEHPAMNAPQGTSQHSQTAKKIKPPVQQPDPHQEPVKSENNRDTVPK